MKKSIGRPMKYKKIIETLDKNSLFTPATIANFAEEKGLLEGTNLRERRLEKQRIRIALGRFSNNHGFPDEGDGMVTLRGQAPTPAWFGWRWKASIRT